MLAHPATWVVGAAAGSLEWGFLTWFQPPWPMTLASLALTLALLVLWPALLVRSRSFALRYYGLPEAAGALAGLPELESELRRLDSTQGVSQLQLLGQKRDNFITVLGRRMDAGELTFARYLDTAEQVYGAAIDNLHEVAVTLASLSSIDREYIDTRVRALRSARAGPAELRARELETLRQRRSLHEQQLVKVAELFAQNEAAMTALDNTAAALVRARTRRGHATLDAEAAMAELEELASRAGRYARDADR